MDVYFLRHAQAEKRQTGSRADDSLRPLTRGGEKQIRRAARAMRRLGLSFDLIFSSPYERAKRTAEIAADVLKSRKKLRFSNALEGEVAPDLLIEELRRCRAPEAVLLVGHEPHLSRVMSLLLVKNESLSVDFQKSGLCKLSVKWSKSAGRATLEWLMTPAQLDLIAKH